jgi:oligoendopeptidase F
VFSPVCTLSSFKLGVQKRCSKFVIVKEYSKMMKFFATEFSRKLPGLLILPSLFLFYSCGKQGRELKVNGLSNEKTKMSLVRSDLPLQEKWNVEALYPDSVAWNLEFEKIKGEAQQLRWPALASFKGKLQDPTAAASLFSFYFELERKLSKLFTYAHLRHDEDLGDDQAKKEFGLISSLYHDFQVEGSWVEPELLALSEADFRRLLSHPSLEFCRFFLEKIGRMRPHTLSPELEEMMALSGKALDTPYLAFAALNNADLTFAPAVDSKGQEHRLTTGSFSSFLRGKDRTLRKTAFENLHKGYQTHANTLCELIQGQMQSHLFLSKARKFSSCLEASLFPHQVDPVVYENLIAAVRRSLPLMHEYIRLRKEILALPELHFYDLAVPLVEEVQISMNYGEACQAVIDSVAPLGLTYQEDLKRGLLEERWVDVYETNRKRSGAYSSGCYDSMPYILMNYQGTLNDVLTLAHEAGHSMHSLLSRRHQSYVYSKYPIFVAEVASTFNEQLLLEHLKRQAKSKEELAYLINYEIEAIRTTIFRQTLFAEFELQMHQLIEKGVPLTPALLSESYMKLNQEYYGPSLVLDPEVAIEWARIPHFYYNFYVYQYATGLSAALSLFSQVKDSDAACSRYLQFLSSGGSLYPLDLLKRAGVDMRSSHAVDAALSRFQQLLAELEKCLY